MSEPFGVNRKLTIHVFFDGPAASEAGYDYKLWEPRPKALQIDEVIVVEQGTLRGNATLDLLMSDEDGNKYVSMVTANLIKALPI